MTILLHTSPPSWFWFAVREGQIAREYVPASDLVNLAWVEPDLSPILVDAHDAIVAR